jgi:hypothetical protein
MTRSSTLILIKGRGQAATENRGASSTPSPIAAAFWHQAPPLGELSRRGPGLREGAPQCPASSKAVRQVPDFRVCTQDHRSRPTVICRSSNALQRHRVSEHHAVGFYSGASTLLPPKAVSLSICRAQNCFHCTHDERLTILNAIISELFCIPDQSVCVKRGIAALPIMKATQPHRDFFCSCNFVTRELSTRQL